MDGEITVSEYLAMRANAFSPKVKFGHDGKKQLKNAALASARQIAWEVNFSIQKALEPKANKT